MNYTDLDLSILKVLITNKKYALEFSQDCSEKVFSTDVWKFAKVIIEYIKAYKEIPTKRVILEKIGSQKNDALLKYFNEIFLKLESFQYDDREYKHDLEKIKIRFSEKVILSLKENLSQSDGKVDIKKALGDIQSATNNIKAITQKKVFNQQTLKECIPEFKQRYIAKAKDPNFGTGILTGYKFLDLTLNGIRNGEMMLLAGETGAGKSTLLMDMAINMYMGDNNINMSENFGKGANVVYFSLEMPLADMENRVVSYMSKTEFKKIINSSLSKEEEGRVGKVLNFFKHYPYDFEIVDMARGCTAETIELVLNDIISKRGKPDVVVVDYLNIMHYDNGKNDEGDWLQQAKISELLFSIGRTYDLVMLSAVQLNSPKMNKSGEPETFGVNLFKRSKQIADNANFIVALAPKRRDEINYPDVGISLVKSRRTELVSATLIKDFAKCGLIENLDHGNIFDASDISVRIENI